MSYILDALKKLEHEKSRKSRSAGMINISGALFENEQSKSSGPSGWKIVLFVLVAVLATFGATLLLLRPDKNRENPVSHLPTPVSSASSIKIEAVPVPAVPPVVVGPHIVAVAPSAPEKKLPFVRQPAKVSKPQAAVVQAATATEGAASLLTAQELPKRIKERKSQAVSSDQTIAAPADITLSGIAWQEERRARRVVVNGFLMQEGGAVSGARITDIFQDRVRFSLSGKIFEIPLTSSGVSDVKK
jgi:general secretion pathway protein B